MKNVPVPRQSQRRYQSPRSTRRLPKSTCSTVASTPGSTLANTAVNIAVSSAGVMTGGASIRRLRTQETYGTISWDIRSIPASAVNYFIQRRAPIMSIMIAREDAVTRRLMKLSPCLDLR